MAIPVAPIQRDPREEALYQMAVSNLLFTAQMVFDKKKPRLAKLLELLNVDFNLKFREYMDEIYGPLKMESSGILQILAESYGGKTRLKEALLQMVSDLEPSA